MPTIDDLLATRTGLEAALGQALRAANGARTRHAQAILHEAFPDHSLAVFARNWDEEHPTLIQLLSGVDGVEDLELSDAAATAGLTSEQHSALGLAEHAIALMGDDDAIHEFLAEPTEEHTDWVEFDLSLIPE